MTLHIVKSLVAFFKLLLFQGFIGKGFHHPDTQEAVFHLGIDLTQLDTLQAELFLHPVVEVHRRNDDKGHNGEHDQRQPHVDAAKDDKRTHDLDAGNEELLRAMVGELRHIKQVGGDAGHDLAHFCVVEIVEGQLLQMVEHCCTHICFDFRTHDVANGRHKEVGGRVHQAQKQVQGADL